MNAGPLNPPRIVGDLDRSYLRSALDRAGRTSPLPSETNFDELSGGRTGATVTAIRSKQEPRYVHKAVSTQRGFVDALGNDGEAVYWLSGATRDLPKPLRNPTIDAAYHEERQEWWLLMDDVSAGIIGRDSWSEKDTRNLFEALAILHAAHWNRLDAPDLVLNTVAGTTAALAQPVAHVATGEPPRHPWVAKVAEEFPVPHMFLPTFLDVLGDDDGDFYVRICRNWRKIATELDRHPKTLLHGDTRRANVAFLDDQISFFDWEFAARGPAAMDLTWHWFLRYWAYPPDDGKSPQERLWLRNAYLDRLDEELADAVDRHEFRVAWDLGWLRVFVQLGYCLVDSLTGSDPSPPEDVERITARCKEAIQMARRIVEDHV